MNQHVIEHGRMFNEIDNENARSVCVIGTTLRDELFGDPEKIGREIIPRSLVLPGHRRRLPVRFVRRDDVPVQLRGTLDYGDPERKTVEIGPGVAR